MLIHIFVFFFFLRLLLFKTILLSVNFRWLSTSTFCYNIFKSINIIYGLEYDDLILVPFGDWKSYLKDVANEFAQCLPDGFEDFVDVESLFNYMLKDTYYLVQAINMINKTSEEDYERYEKVDSGEVDSISYVIVREVI